MSLKTEDARTMVEGPEKPGAAPKEVDKQQSNPESEAIQAVDQPFLQRTRDCLRVGMDFQDTEIQSQWERNRSSLRSQHAPGSKYNTRAYANRSRTFDPMTRTIVRNHEATAALAMFGSDQVVTLEPWDRGNPLDRASCAIQSNLLERYTAPDSEVRWFQHTMGAYQDSMVYGVVIGKMDWAYKKDAVGDVYEDRPRATLIRPENGIFDRNCDWANPVESSTFFIERIPMAVDEVMKKIKKGTWRTYTEEFVRANSTRAHVDNATAQANARFRGPAPEAEGASRIKEDTKVDIYEVACRIDGIDMRWVCLSEMAILSDPVALARVYVGGRPWVVGYSSLETHTVYPQGTVEMVQSLQASGNDLRNLRFDTVKNALHPKFLVRRGQILDKDSLRRGAPGAQVEVDDPTGDVRELKPQDVTSRAYEEDDRNQNKADTLAGTFNSASVAANQSLNKTVGGLNLMANSNNNVGDYQLLVFVITYVYPMLVKMLANVVKKETDLDKLTEAALDAHEKDPEQRVPVNEETGESDWDSVMQSKPRVKLNVAMGGINPVMRLNKLMSVLQLLATVRPDIVMALDKDNLAAEAFGVAGYSNHERFMGDEPVGEDPLNSLEGLKIQSDMENAALDRDLAVLKMEHEGMLKQGEWTSKEKIAHAQLIADMRSRLAEMKLKMDPENRSGTGI